MAKAKEIVLKFISSKDANMLCKQWHYSGKVTPNSQLHIGVFLNNFCEGVLQFGPSLDKRRMSKNLNIDFGSFLELNRMDLSDNLPKNSESRALSISHKIIKKHYPHIKLILSFSDATQCGDGAIYRAAGYKLIDIKKNTSIVELSDKAHEYVKKFIPKATKIIANKSLNDYIDGTRYLSATALEMGFKPLVGYQLKYIYYLDEKLWSNYKYIEFSKIKEIGASMYKGIKTRQEHESNVSEFRSEEGGAIPTLPLQLSESVVSRKEFAND